MRGVAKLDVSDALGNLDGPFGAMLRPMRERQLLEELGRCRRKLAEVLAHDPGLVIPDAADGPAAISRLIGEVYASRAEVARRNEAFA